jgi:hypothetical protein
MKQIQQHHYHSPAEQEFQESLSQLAGILQEKPQVEVVKPRVEPNRTIDSVISKHTDMIDLAAFEDAVADIERYLSQKSKKTMSAYQ